MSSLPGETNYRREKFISWGREGLFSFSSLISRVFLEWESDPARCRNSSIKVEVSISETEVPSCVTEVSFSC